MRLARWLDLRTPTFEGFMQWTLDLRREIGIPHTLAELGVKAEHLDKFSEMAAVDPTAGGNPVKAGRAGDAQDVRSSRRREALMAANFPTQARVVIVGGGIMGCSTAYHLAKHGWKDIVLLEQGRLSGGTTWHAAGLVGQLRSYQNLTRLIRYSTELYSRLEAETGLATGWKQCGSLTVARTEERMTLLRRSAAMANAQGVVCEPLTPQQAGDKYPIMRTDDLVGAVWLPGDGKANPADITQALAKGARNGGVRIFEKTRVTAIDTEDGPSGPRVTGVQTTEGPIKAEIVVNCGGQWARQLGRMVGVTVPLYSCEHMYIVTEKMEGVPRDLPVMRDPDGYIYFKEEVGGLLMGGFEPEAKPWNKDVIPDDFEFGMLPDDWEQFQILMDNALIRVPSLEKTGIKTFMNGPESFTPDLNYILGEAPQLRGFYVGAGFNSMGIASSGGAGMALAEWIVAGEPTMDLWPVDIRRFAGFHGNDAWLRSRVAETLGLHYKMPWPQREQESGRPFRRSPLYDRLKARGALFGNKMGWERPNWFAGAGKVPEMEYGWGRGALAAGSMRSPPSIAPRARASRSPTRPRSASCWCRDAMPKPRCSAFAPTTSPCRSAAPSTPAC